MPETVPRLLDPDTFTAEDHPGLLLVDVGDPARYAQTHLPGARLVVPSWLVSGQPPAPGRLPPPAQIEAVLARIGWRPDRHVVIYDDEGGGWAGRFAWTLDVIGHDHWSYLDGGLHAWYHAGRPLADGPDDASAMADETPGAAPGVTLRQEPVASLDDVRAAIGDPGQLIWDVRSAEEYRGEKSGSRRAGHVPGAVHLDWQALKDPARHLRLQADLRGLLARHGIVPERRVITHCQSHHRSGLSYLAGRLLDFPDIRAYDGSWAEWGNRDDTPVATGPEPGGAADR